jgi:hypothetical protein
LTIFGSETIYPLTPALSPQGEGFTKIKDTKERTTKEKPHKAIIAKPKFQQGNEGDG